MDRVEAGTKQQIPASRSIVKLVPRTAIVTIVSELARFNVEVVGPIWFREGAKEHDEVTPWDNALAIEAKSTLISDGSQARKGIIGRAASHAASINRIDDEVGGR
jgi:hypothetical protein